MSNTNFFYKKREGVVVWKVLETEQHGKSRLFKVLRSFSGAERVLTLRGRKYSEADSLASAERFPNDYTRGKLFKKLVLQA